MSIVLYPQSDAGLPRGSERSMWWIGRPVNVGDANWWFIAKTVSPSSAQMTNIAQSAGSYVMVQNADYGLHRAITGNETTNGTFQLLNAIGVAYGGYPMNKVAGALAPPFQEVYVFQECFAITWTGTPNGNALCGHGFTLLSNMINPSPNFTSGPWRGIGLFRRFPQGKLVLAWKNANPATVIDLPLPDGYLDNVPRVVQHRLYSPSPTAIGRYELWVDGVRVAVVPGDTPNFPTPNALANQFRPMPFTMDHPGTGAIFTQRALWGEIFAGTVSDGTL